ncbi:MAG: phosphotransferase family protein, partial [Dehalococcoidia bacterium]
MSYELTKDSAVDYLVSQGLVTASRVCSVELLGWGVSNTLVKVCLRDDCLVIKQSLAQLRVAGEWFADRDRIDRERACIEVLSGILSPRSVPQVRHADPDNYLFVMSCAPEGGVNWKEQLLGGEVDREVAHRVGEVLGQVHSRTSGDLRVRDEFIDDQPFIQLRIDPYHRRTAQAHPDLAELIHREARHMLEVKEVLVHGDYSPKNIIVTSGEVFLLDFEVVHYGNPVFDLAFMLSHLFLKSIHLPDRQSHFFQAV